MPDSKAPTASCPFCRRPVARDIIVFGGACPHCLIDIPGEEAPTDPGEALQQKLAAQEQRPNTAHRLGWAALLLIVLMALGAAITMRFFGTTVTRAVAQKFPILGIEAHRDQSLPDDLQGPPSVAQADARRAPTQHTRRSQRAPAQPEVDSQLEVDSQVEVVNSDSLDGFAVVGPAPRSKLTGKVLEDPEEVEDAIGAVFQLRKKDVDACFSARHAQRSSLPTQWDVGFVVGTANAATDAWATPMDGGDSTFQSCVVKSIRSWTFPRLAKPYTYSYPYRYGA